MATHIKDILKEFLEKKKRENGFWEGLKQEVEKHLEPKLKGGVKIISVKKDKLMFYADQAGLRYEFNLHKQALLAKISQRFPQIKEIEIKG